jgi:hypothetical protein
MYGGIHSGVFMAVYYFVAANFETQETVDGEWLVTCNGIQWGEGPYDISGCSSQTWKTEREALDAIREQIAF